MLFRFLYKGCTFATSMENDTYKYRSTIVASYIAALANEKRVNINMTKMQKLLYVAYGLFLVVKNERLTDEYAKAWPYGPVFPTTRNKLLKTDLTGITLEDEKLQDIKNDPEMQSLMDLVFKSFGTMSAGSLTEWSHQQGSPWDKTIKADGFKWGDPIPDVYIKEYFESIVVRDND